MLVEVGRQFGIVVHPQANVAAAAVLCKGEHRRQRLIITLSRTVGGQFVEMAQLVDAEAGELYVAPMTVYIHKAHGVRVLLVAAHMQRAARVAYHPGRVVAHLLLFVAKVPDGLRAVDMA